MDEQTWKQIEEGRYKNGYKCLTCKKTSFLTEDEEKGMTLKEARTCPLCKTNPTTFINKMVIKNV